jgi:hypothetical protein
MSQKTPVTIDKRNNIINIGLFGSTKNKPSTHDVNADPKNHEMPFAVSLMKIFSFSHLKYFVVCMLGFT